MLVAQVVQGAFEGAAQGTFVLLSDVQGGAQGARDEPAWKAQAAPAAGVVSVGVGGLKHAAQVQFEGVGGVGAQVGLGVLLEQGRRKGRERQ